MVQSFGGNRGGLVAPESLSKQLQTLCNELWQIDKDATHIAAGATPGVVVKAMRSGGRRTYPGAPSALNAASTAASSTYAVIGATARMAPARCNPNRPCRRCRMAVTSDAEARGCGAVAIWCAAPPS
jgi:hypothetical protein